MPHMFLSGLYCPRGEMGGGASVLFPSKAPTPPRFPYKLTYTTTLISIFKNSKCQQFRPWKGVGVISFTAFSFVQFVKKIGENAAFLPSKSRSGKGENCCC